MFECQRSRPLANRFFRIPTFTQCRTSPKAICFVTRVSDVLLEVATMRFGTHQAAVSLSGNALVLVHRAVGELDGQDLLSFVVADRSHCCR